jgi:hypothetical protein
MTSNRLSRLRFAIVSLGLFVFALPAMAQTPVPAGQVAAPSTVSVIPEYAERLTGKDVRITADGVQHRGVVSSLSTAGLVLVENGTPATISFSRIARVEKVTHRVRNGTLVGLAAGAGLGVWVGLMCEGDAASGCAAQFVALLTGIGAGAGAGVGALVHAGRKRGDVLYEAPRRTPTMSFAPILSPSRKGVAFVVAWR